MGPVIYGMHICPHCVEALEELDSRGISLFCAAGWGSDAFVGKSYKKLYNRLKVIKSYIEGEKIEQSIYIIFWKKTTKVYLQALFRFF